MEFLVDITTSLPADMEPEVLAGVKSRERARGEELMAEGRLRRIWRQPGRRASISLYRVADATELHEVLSSLPQFPWMDIEITPLAEHPLDSSAPG